MSHGPPSESGITAEPNLTPMLDMVMQILMFFIICADFNTRVTSVGMNLPESDSAKIKEETDESYLFVNVKPFDANDYKELKEHGLVGKKVYDELLEEFKDGGSSIVVIPENPPRQVTTVKRDLKTAYDDAKIKNVEVTVIIRADKDVRYEEIYQVMQICKQVGFTKLKISAMNTGGKT